MKFYDHRNLSGLHAPFTASQSSWLRYDDEKVLEVYANKKAAEMGSRLHEWAAETIKLGLKQPKTKKTICAYVNDAIGFKMETEVVLFYSERFFGTADAICFRNNTLRIHDLKTGKVGKIESHMEQLEVYTALFCLEYRVKPSDIQIELRLYKNDEVIAWNPEVETIVRIMDHIVHLDKLLEKVDREEE
jgi:hypothetical protein